MLVMARYHRGGKRWIQYDTAQNITIRYGPKMFCRILLYTQVGLWSTVWD